ncbi:DUF5686 family protein [candidate division KSB1 bacterium]
MHRIKHIILLVLFLSVIPFSLYSQVKLYGAGGYIRDKETNEPLPYAHIRILGTSQGSVSNEDGYYFIVLKEGSYRLLFSYIGYDSDTMSVNITDKNIEQDIYLDPAAALQREIVVKAFRHNPAERIILRAIQKKHEVLDKLENIEFSAYSKSVFFADITKKGVRDTNIVGILETHSSGYRSKPDKYKEIINSRRQTANFNSAQNTFSLGKIPDLNDDVISFDRNRIIGPINPNSLDYYSFDMIDTTAVNGIMIFRIRMEPKKENIPLFRGGLSIADSTYSIMDIDVSFNDAFQLPPLKNFRVREKFALYDEIFWLPVDVIYEFDFGFLDIIPRVNKIYFKQTSTIHDYRINTSDFDNKIFDEYLISVDPEADETDSLTWASRQAVPLTDGEEFAYREIEKEMKSPFGRAVKFVFQSPFNFDKLPITEFSDFYRLNRVEGNYLGAGFKFDRIYPQTSLTITGGYGFADENFKYKIEPEQYFTAERLFSLGGSLYKRLNNTYPELLFSTSSNTFLALFNKVDYYDYYLTEGWNVFGRWRPLPRTMLELSYGEEYQKSQEKNSDFSLFGSGRYRENPDIFDGRYNGFGLSFGHDSRKFFDIGVIELPVSGENGWIITADIDHSLPGFHNCDFDFTRLFFTLRRDQFTHGVGYFVFKVIGGLSTGTLPYQNLFSLPGSISDFSSFGAFRTIETREFSGDRMAAVHFEYNLGSYLFRTLKIPYFRKRHYDLILFTSGGMTDISSMDPGIFEFPVRTTGSKNFWEAGFGLGGILFFRLDFTWRLTHKYENKFVIRLGSSLY